MLKHLFLVLLLTFIVGLMTGVYAYFMTSGPREAAIEEPEAEEGSFEVVADMYGGCQMLGDCPSYRLTETGDYMYVVRTRGSEDERFEDALSRTQTEEVGEMVRETDFEAVEDSVFTDTCPIAYDGAAYRYTITYGGDTYEVDTCAEDVFGVALFVTLENYFEVFGLLHGSE